MFRHSLLRLSALFMLAFGLLGGVLSLAQDNSASIPFVEPRQSIDPNRAIEQFPVYPWEAESFEAAAPQSDVAVNLDVVAVQTIEPQRPVEQYPVYPWEIE